MRHRRLAAPETALPALGHQAPPGSADNSQTPTRLVGTVQGQYDRLRARGQVRLSVLSGDWRTGSIYPRRDAGPRQLRPRTLYPDRAYRAGTRAFQLRPETPGVCPPASRRQQLPGMSLPGGHVQADLSDVR